MISTPKPSQANKRVIKLGVNSATMSFATGRDKPPR